MKLFLSLLALTVAASFVSSAPGKFNQDGSSKVKREFFNSGIEDSGQHNTYTDGGWKHNHRQFQHNYGPGSFQHNHAPGRFHHHHEPNQFEHNHGPGNFQHNHEPGQHGGCRHHHRSSTETPNDFPATKTPTREVLTTTSYDDTVYVLIV